MGYYGNEGLVLAWDFNRNFLMRTKFMIQGLEKIPFLLILDLKGAIEKHMGWFLAYLF